MARSRHTSPDAPQRGLTARLRPGASGWAGAPQRRPTHCRAKRV